MNCTDCTATFTPKEFHVITQSGLTLLNGRRTSASGLWLVWLGNPSPSFTPTIQATQAPTLTANHVYRPTTAAQFVRFVHASLGFPTPSTFLHAVSAGYITGEGQYTRLTSKMVRRHMPQAEATARGHLDKAHARPPHQLSDATSALRRLHDRNTRAKIPKLLKTFDCTTVPKSTILHLDYTGDLPEVCLSGTRCFMVSCWGSYIHLQPLTSLRTAQTTAALQRTLTFWTARRVLIETIRMDNQYSSDFAHALKDKRITLSLVSPYDKAPNRAERAIRTTYIERGFIEIVRPPTSTKLYTKSKSH